MVLPRKPETDMTERDNHEIRELAFDELEQVRGGSILNRIIDAYEAALGARLMDAIHPRKTMSLSMR